MNVVRRPDGTAAIPDAATAAEILARFSRGEMGRHDAMEALGDISYYELLDRMAEARLPLFSLPPEQLKVMADKVAELLTLAGR
jgi:hypothetical protein